ncbi:MAG: hypothetical protein AAFO91_05555, partial [Bacteroidota bacterium]
MKWYGITGSWRETTESVESDVRLAVRNIIQRGDGIVTGGAPNVDYFASSEALKHNPTGEYIKVFIPTNLWHYTVKAREREAAGRVSSAQTAAIIETLTTLKALGSLIEESTNTELSTRTYFSNNTRIVAASDEMLGFQV